MDIRTFIAGALGILIALDVHEFFHAWVADWLGDPTARYLGRISLNPLVHLDPLGTLMLFLAATTGRGIGWGKPVPVNPNRLRYGPRVGMGIVSFAGPFANLVTAAAFGLPLRLGAELPGTLSVLFLQIMFINIGLAIFNLIPLPPLDGAEVILLFFPEERAEEIRHRLRTLGLFGLFLAWLVFSRIFPFVWSWVARLL